MVISGFVSVGIAVSVAAWNTGSKYSARNVHLLKLCCTHNKHYASEVVGGVLWWCRVFVEV